MRTMAFALLAGTEVLAAYLSEVEVPEPALVEIQFTRAGQFVGAKVQVQGYQRSTREQAADLVAWSRTLSTPRVRAWRQPRSEMVLVTVSGTASHRGAEVLVGVYACMAGPGPFADLTEGSGRASSVREIERWAWGEPPLGSVALTCTGCECTYEPTREDWDSGHTGCPRCGSPTLTAELSGGRRA